MNSWFFTKVITVSLSLVLAWFGQSDTTQQEIALPIIEASGLDTTPPLRDREGNFINDPAYNPYDLKDPNAIKKDVEYDPVTGKYIITERIGDEYYRAPSYMNFRDFQDWKGEQQEREYFKNLSGVSTGENKLQTLSVLDPVKDIDLENLLIDRLFGGTDIEISPRGNIDLTFGYDYQRVLNPNIPIRAQRQGIFDFDMDINMSVEGRIGKKLNLNFNYNTGAAFNFDNQINIDYNSAEFSEDDILQRIEAGNVSLPQRNSLIQGSESLLGILAEWQFGRLRLTSLVSQQRSRQQQIQLENGAQVRRFEVYSDEYDEFRHFFLSHYNRQVFEPALQNLPLIQTQFKIKRLEVYITNDRQEFQDTRDVVAIADLGTPTNFTMRDSNNVKFTNPTHVDPSYNIPLPGREIVNNVPANRILEELERRGAGNRSEDIVRTLQSAPFNMEQGRDFEKINARKLNPSEYDFHPELGFLSVRSTLRPDQVLGVAFEYDFNGKTYRVGQFSNEHYDGDSLGVLFIKMLKGTTPNVSLPLWDLMMKNVYSIGAYNASTEDFQLDIFYDDPGGGQKRFLPILPNQPLLQIFNLDNLNVQRDPAPDGVFDFVPGLTIFPATGRVMFPVLEPFGSSLAKQLPDDPLVQNEYIYQVLYDSTVWRAREYPSLNRFAIRGQFKSSISREISLGAFNLPEGSVVVRAGGQILREGIDYTVNYGIGQVVITNDAFLTSGVPINISFEDNTLFGIQQQTMIGLRADYMASKKLNIGATYMHLFERPFTAKVNIGDDPISNRVYGLDFNYNSEAPWLTKAVDKLPFIDTKAASSISLTAEAAMIDPGSARAVRIGDDREATVFLDDFEGSTTSDDLRQPVVNWVLSSVPQGDRQFSRFPEAELINDIRSNANRAKISWYRIDLTLRNNQDQDDPYARLVRQREIFPNVQLPPNQRDIINPLEITYYPDRRGPYNFDPPTGTEFSAGVEWDQSSVQPRLKDPDSRWGGIMRQIRNTDFERANYEFIEFWLLNPFLDSESREQGPATDGELYFNLGNISEDVLRDSRIFFEDGLPTSEEQQQPDTTNMGLIPRTLSLINAFDQNEENRAKQDLGFDGFDDDGERQFFGSYIQALAAGGAPQSLLDGVNADPAYDNYVCFREEQFDNAIERYEDFNNPQGNSPITNAGDRLPCNATARPDREDINFDNSLNETEAYYEYRIPLRRGAPTADGQGFELDTEAPDVKPFITDTVGTANGTWYRFKVPIDQYDRKVGNVSDFRSIRFMRMYMTGFERMVTLRFARLELVRSQWRRYRVNDLRDPSDKNDGLPTQCGSFNSVSFDINDVNIEENSGRQPFNYVLPRGINREQGIGAFPEALQNEQSLSLTICNMDCKEQRAVYKNVGNFQMNVYKNLKMFLHAEVNDIGGSAIDVEDGDAAFFIRIGSDFTRNFYEYEIPLVFSKPENIVGRSNNDDTYIDEVWRLENDIDLALELLRDLKLERNDQGAVNEFYTIIDPNNPDRKLSIIGNPTLGGVKSIMMGVRSKSEGTFGNKCIEIWTNELRLTGLDDRSAVATSTRVDMQLADFGTINAEANYSGIGYGNINQKVAERNREELISYSFTGQANLGKFLPQKANISIPFIYQYFQQTSNPEYDPYDLDIRLKDKLAFQQDQAKRDSLRRLAQDFNRITTVGFNNVRKSRTSQGIPLPWDISNFDLTYVFTRNFRRSPLIEFDDEKHQLARLGYRYSIKPLTLRPFKKLIKKDKYFKWLSELNFNPIPNNIEFNNELNRSFRITKYRFTGQDVETPANTFFNKYFTWDRTYRLNWDIAQNLKMDYSATANTVIDEPFEFDPSGERISNQNRQDSIWTNIRDLGRMKNYQQNLNISYTLPTRNIPFLEWVTVRGQYNARYNWSAAPLNLDSLGNVISNSQTRALNGDLNFEQLYNKSKFLQSINRGNRSRGRRGRPGSRRSQNLPQANQPPDDDKKKAKKKKGEPSKAARALLRPLMALRRARLTFNEDLQTVIPGFLPVPKYVGLSDGFDAPGWQFAFGLQPNIDPNTNDWLRQAATKGWMSENFWVTQEVTQTYQQRFDARITLEPINDFRIELTANRTYQEQLALMFRDSAIDNYTDPNEIVHLTPRENGSFTISYNTLGTLFGTKPKSLFQTFERNRILISERLDQRGVLHEDPDQAGEGYRGGYGELQQDVLLNAFLNTYANEDPNSSKLLLGKDDFRSMMPRLNWNIQYNGLSRVKGMNKVFTGFNLNHQYRSTLTINNFQTDAESAFGGPNNVNNNFDFYSAYVIPNVQIQEVFAPLIGIDMKFVNDINLAFNYNKGRNLAFSFTDYKLVETLNTDYDFEFGYIIKDFRFGLFESERARRRRQRKQNQQQNNQPPAQNQRPGQQQQDNSKDLTLRFTFSFGDNRTLVHLLDRQGEPQDTRGSKRVAFEPSAQYELNRQLSLRFFYNYTRSTPYTSNAFPITNWQTGVTVRFSLN